MLWLTMSDMPRVMRVPKVITGRRYLLDILYMICIYTHHDIYIVCVCACVSTYVIVLRISMSKFISMIINIYIIYTCTCINMMMIREES